jgi:hypothetical protein
MQAGLRRQDTLCTATFQVGTRRASRRVFGAPARGDPRGVLGGLFMPEQGPTELVAHAPLPIEDGAGARIQALVARSPQNARKRRPCEDDYAVGSAQQQAASDRAIQRTEYVPTARQEGSRARTQGG